MRYAVVFAAGLLLAGCDWDDWSGVPKMRCFDGKLYEWWNGAWVQANGRGYMGKTDGPIACIAPPEVKK